MEKSKDEICTCICHKEGDSVTHCAPCCNHTYADYIEESGEIDMEKYNKLTKIRYPEPKKGGTEKGSGKCPPIEDFQKEEQKGSNCSPHLPDSMGSACKIPMEQPDKFIISEDGATPVYSKPKKKEKVIVVPPETQIQKAYGTNKNGTRLSRGQLRRMRENSKAMSLVYVNYIKAFKKVMGFDKSELDFTENTKAAIAHYDKLWKHHCRSKGFIGEETLTSFINETEVIKCVLILETRDSMKADINKLIGLHKKNKLSAVELADLYLDSLTK